MYSALALMLRCVLEKMQNKSKLRSTTKRNKVGDVSLQTKSWVATSAGVNNSNIYFDILITFTGFSVRCSQLPQPPVRLQRPPDSVSQILNSPIVDFTQNEASRLQTTGFFQSPSGRDTLNIVQSLVSLPSKRNRLLIIFSALPPPSSLSYIFVTLLLVSLPGNKVSVPLANRTNWNCINTVCVFIDLLESFIWNYMP